jgi:hypothetical protein
VKLTQRQQSISLRHGTPVSGGRAEASGELSGSPMQGKFMEIQNYWKKLTREK